MSHCDPSTLSRLAIATTRRVAASIIICLVMAGCLLSSKRAAGFAKPTYWILATFSCLLCVPFKADLAKTVQKLLAAYLVAVSVDCMADAHWHVASNLQVAAGLPVAMAAVLGAALVPHRQPRGGAASDLPTALGVAAVMLAILLLATSLLVHSYYGSRAAQCLGVIGQVAMAVLAALSGWHLSGEASIRTAVGVVAVASYSWMAIS